MGFQQRYAAAKCNTASPPAGCDALTTEMFTLAGTCYGSNNWLGNACSDNLVRATHARQCANL